MGRSHVLKRILEKNGRTWEEVEKELQRRQTVLDWMVRKKVRKHTDVAKIIREYYANSDRIFRKARMGH